MHRFTRQETYTPLDLNLKARAINTAANSTPFGVDGANELSLLISYTRAAGTGFTFLLQASDDLGVTWYTKNVASFSAGTGALDVATFTDNTASSHNVWFSYPIHAGESICRLASVTATGAPSASDTITVKAYVGWA